MAYLNFYLIAAGTGSADINAGTTIGAAQAAPATNGNWNATTGVFIAASGTPFASTVVGDYASVYVDGATVTTFVSRVLTVTSSTQITIDIATLKYGTAPSTSATGRSCVIGGSWTSELPLAAGGLASTTIPSSTKFNIKNNLTVAATRVFSMNGTTTAILWFSGYNTTPGDLDNDKTGLAIPSWTYNSTFQHQTSGAYQTWSNISIVGNRAGSTWLWSGSGPAKLTNVAVSNILANTAAVAMNTGGIVTYCEKCWFSATSTATVGTVNGVGVGSLFSKCVWEGGGLACCDCGTSSCTFSNCIVRNSTATSGILAGAARIQLYNFSVYGALTNGIKWTGTPAAGSAVIGCMFSGLNSSTAMTNGINNSTGVNTNNVLISANDYYNVTNTEVGFGDAASFYGVTDTNPVMTSATDMTPVAGSNALVGGSVGLFNQQTFQSYLPNGAVVPAAASGGGNAVAIFGS